MAIIRDFYTRTEDDPNYQVGKIENNDQTEEIVQQIKMTLLTNKGEVLGEPSFGVDIERYLFSFDVDPFGLASIAQTQISEYISLSQTRNIKVEPARLPDNVTGYGRDMLVLNINIDGDKDFAILYD